MLTITRTPARFDLAFQNVRPAIALAVQRAMRDIGIQGIAALMATMGSGGAIGVRTGNMRRNVRMDGPNDNGDSSWSVTVYDDQNAVPYFAIQNVGGTIVPKKGQALAIPIGPALTGNGVARFTAAEVRANPQAFGFQATFIPKGKNVIMGRIADAHFSATRGQGGRGALVPLFVLVKSVTLPARDLVGIAASALSAFAQSRLEQALGEPIEIVLNGGSPA